MVRPQPRLLTRSFAFLVLANFLQALGYASMPLFPELLAARGLDRASIGTVLAVASVSGLLSRPLVGWALDRWGRKPTVAVGTLLLALSLGLVGLLRGAGPLLVVIRLLYGLGTGALFTGYFTFVSDVVPEQRRTEGIAIFGVFGLVPLAVNPLVERLHLPPAGLQLVFPLVGLLVASSLLPLLALPEPRFERQRGGRFREALSRRDLLPLWWAVVLFSAPVSAYFSFASVAARDLGLENPGALWLAYVAGAAAVRLFGSRLPDRLGPRRLVVPSLAVYGLGLLVLAGARSQGALYSSGLLAGFGHGYCFPVLMSSLSRRVPQSARGSATSVFTALFDLAGLAYTPLFGAAADAWGDGAMFSLVAAGLAAGLAVWVLLEQLLGPREPGGSAPRLLRLKPAGSRSGGRG